MPLEQEPRLSFNVPSKWTNRFIAVGLPHGVRIIQAMTVVMLAAIIGPDCARNFAKSDGALIKVVAAKITVDQENANRITSKKSKR
jgi:hypothetical protein